MIRSGAGRRRSSRPSVERDEASDAARAVGGRNAVLALQRAAGNGAVTALHRGGAPLPDPERRRMERSFGHDFGDVRVHPDADAEAVVGPLGASAVTVGRDIWFAAGAYAPGQERGRRVLAHELAHVVQQTARSGAPVALVSRPGDSGEREADAAARVAAGGGMLRSPLSAPSAAVQRQKAPPVPGDEPVADEPVIRGDFGTPNQTYEIEFKRGVGRFKFSGRFTLAARSKNVAAAAAGSRRGDTLGAKAAFLES
jgi:hypothetical protein